MSSEMSHLVTVRSVIAVKVKRVKYEGSFHFLDQFGTLEELKIMKMHLEESSVVLQKDKFALRGIVCMK